MKLKKLGVDYRKKLIFIIPLFLMIGCRSQYSYSYGSGSKKEIKRVQTDIQDLKLESLTGMSESTRTYYWDFKKYLK